MENEILKQEERTPIEVALEMNEDGMVSAKKLYEFLELEPSHYARWCNTYILTNEAVSENSDWKRLESSVVNSLRQSGENLGGRPSDDYLLTIDFAKNLCMTSRNEKGRLAREYFKKTEQALVITVKEYKDLVLQLKQATEQFSRLEARLDEVDKLSTNNAARLACYESGAILGMDHEEAWLNEMEENIKKLADAWPGINGDLKKCLDRIIDRIEYKDLFRRPFQEYINDFKRHNPGVKAYRLTVIAAYEDLRDSFEYVLYELMETYGLKKRVDICEFFSVEDATIDYSEDNYYHSKIMTDEECEEAYNGIEFLKKLYGEPQ